MKRYFALLFSCLLLISGCWILPFPQVVTLRLPEIPPGWSGSAFQFTLSYPDSTGEIVWRRDLAPGDRVVYLLPRDPPAPVAAYPHPLGWRAPVPGLKCAGAFYPLEGGGTRPLELTWQDGFLAELLQRLTPEERAPLNIPVIREKIAAVSPEDSWAVDAEALLDALLYHRFTSAAVKPLPTHTWGIPGGWDGYWRGNPLIPYSPGAEDASVMAEGIHFLGSPDGTDFVRLEITEDGWRGLSLGSGAVLSGPWD